MSGTIDCGERLSIDQAEKIMSLAETALASSEDIILQASQVSYCDTAGLQLLVALRQSLIQTGHDIEWQDPTKVIFETAGYLGLVEHLNL